MSGVEKSAKERLIDGINSCFRARDQFIVWIERGYIGFAVVVIVILFSYMNDVGGFIQHELFSGVDNFRQAHLDILGASSALIVLSMVAAFLSIIIACLRTTPWYAHVGFQCYLLFLVFIPFAVQSQFLTFFSMLDSGEFADHCNKTTNYEAG